MQKKYSVREKLAYLFDRTLQRGTAFLILSLGLGTVTIVFLTGVVLVLAGFGPGGDPPPGLLEAIWIMFMRTLDPGVMAEDTGWGFRVLSLLATLGGILIASSLIGVITSGITERLAELKKGHAPLPLSNHYVILGWSERIPVLVQQLVVANESQQRADFAILAPLDPEVIYNAIAERVSDWQTTRIHIRSGSPAVQHHLDLVNPENAKTIFVASGEQSPAGPGAARVLLSLVTRQIPATTKIVAELERRELLEAFQSVVGKQLIPVFAKEFQERVAILGLCNSGVATAYEDLLNFEGTEVYTVRPPRRIAGQFGDLFMLLKHGVALGIVDAEGKVQLCPPVDAQVGEEDHLIVLAADDSLIAWSDTSFEFKDDVIDYKTMSTPSASRHLIVGWSAVGDALLKTLCKQCKPGSEITVALWNQAGLEQVMSAIQRGNGRGSTAHVKVTELVGLHGVGDLVEKGQYDNIVILCDTACTTSDDPDADVLLAQYLVHQALTRAGQEGRTRVAVELMLESDVSIAKAIGRHDDFVVAESLVSQLIAQLLENPRRSTIFNELFDLERYILGVKPVEALVYKGDEFRFGDACSSFLRHQHICLGFRDRAGRIILNPSKDLVMRMAEIEAFVVLQGVARNDTRST